MARKKIHRHTKRRSTTRRRTKRRTVKRRGAYVLLHKNARGQYRYVCGRRFVKKLSQAQRFGLAEARKIFTERRGIKEIATYAGERAHLKKHGSY